MMTLNIFQGYRKRENIAALLKSLFEDIHTLYRFRPISLESCLFKNYEYALFNSLKNSLNSQCVFIKEQFRFQAHNSTQHHLWRTSEFLHDGIRSF